MKFKAQLQAFADKSEENLSLLTRKVVLDIGRRIVERTPVGDPDFWQKSPPPGYAGGRARGSWQYGLNTPSGETVESIDPTGRISIERIESDLKPVPGIHYITSNLPYMERLENGYSRQAPRGMVGLVQVEFSGIVNTAIVGIGK